MSQKNRRNKSRRLSSAADRRRMKRRADPNSLSHPKEQEYQILNEILRIPQPSTSPLNIKFDHALSKIFQLPWLQDVKSGRIFIYKGNKANLISSKNYRLNAMAKTSLVELSKPQYDAVVNQQKIVFLQKEDLVSIFHDESIRQNAYVLPIVTYGNTLGVIELYLAETHLIAQSEMEYLSSIAEIIGNLLIAHSNHEKLMESREKALRAEKLKGEFLANMSHEIRTPLNGIVGMAEILKSEISNKTQKEHLGIIIDCSQSLMKIINDILDYSKIEASKMELEEIDFNLRKQLEDTVTLFSPEATKKRIKLELEIDSDVPSYVSSDKTRIKQVLNNLINNALKFTEKGSVGIFVTLLEGPDSTSYIQFRIKDTGIGIPEEDQKKLFRKFSQVDASTTRRYGGTGLGLSITKSLVELLGGKISLFSKPGKGSTFVFTIKFKEATKIEQLPQKPRLVPLKDAQPISILAVDDNPTNIIVLSQLLKKLNLDCETATNGVEALKALESKNYDLIFIDCHMPEMDGFETTTEIVKRYGKNKPYIVAVSASAMKADKDRCFRSGMDHFISKPVNLQELQDAIERHLAAPLPAPESKNVESIESQKPKGEEDKKIVNYDILSAQYSHDIEFIKSVVEVFLPTVEEMLREVEASVEKQDLKLIKDTTHAFKGAASNVFAERTINVILQMEEAISQQELVLIDSLLVELKFHVKDLLTELSAIMSTESVEGLSSAS